MSLYEGQLLLHSGAKPKKKKLVRRGRMVIPRALPLPGTPPTAAPPGGGFAAPRAGMASLLRTHLGTDAQAGGWLFLAGSVMYMCWSALMVADFIGADHAPRRVAAWSNCVAAVLYLLGSVYFVKLSYPDTLAAFEASARDADLRKLGFVERYVTFNELLIATWFFFFATSIYDIIGVTWICYGAPTVGLLWIGGTLSVQLLLLLWIYGATPDAMQQNGGAGSSRVYDALCGCEHPFCRSNFGSDALLANWLFFLSCFAATGYAFLLVLFVPLSAESWLFFGSMAPFAAGSYLYVRATKVPNGSLLFGDPPGGSDATTPLLAKPVVKVQP